MRIERIWAMPSRWTFTIKPIRRLLDEEMGGLIWVDPFAGKYSLAYHKNDLDPSMPTEKHMDALDFLKTFPNELCDGVLYDPPYSFRQASECYKSFGREKFTATVTSKKYWKNIKDEIARIIRPGGKVISFGWNTNGLGKNRGFEMQRILIVPHGGSMNDTLCTVETRLTSQKQPFKTRK